MAFSDLVERRQWYDDSYEVSDTKANTVRNTMRFNNLRRED